MSMLERATARSAGAETKSPIWHKFGRALSQDENNPFSPVLCISLLLIVGLAIKFGPAIHGFLAQNH
jgi:hypothetical protein